MLRSVEAVSKNGGVSTVQLAPYDVVGCLCHNGTNGLSGGATIYVCNIHTS